MQLVFEPSFLILFLGNVMKSWIQYSFLNTIKYIVSSSEAYLYRK